MTVLSLTRSPSLSAELERWYKNAHQSRFKAFCEHWLGYLVCIGVPALCWAVVIGLLWLAVKGW